MKNNARYIIVFLSLIGLILLLTVMNINTGNVSIPAGEIAKILFTGQGGQFGPNIIYKIRLPRLLMAGLLGGALALAGFLLQTFFSNPIAGPFVLGIRQVRK